VIWTVAMLFALRVLEPELFPYFMAPTLALAPIGAARRPWWRLGSAGVLAVWLTWWLHKAVRAEWSLWLILVAQLVLLGWLAYPGRARPSPGKQAPPATPSARRKTVPTDRAPQLADRGS
jgi:hypothetical protein